MNNIKQGSSIMSIINKIQIYIIYIISFYPRPSPSIPGKIAV